MHESKRETLTVKAGDSFCIAATETPKPLWLGPDDEIKVGGIVIRVTKTRGKEAQLSFEIAPPTFVKGRRNPPAALDRPEN